MTLTHEEMMFKTLQDKTEPAIFRETIHLEEHQGYLTIHLLLLICGQVLEATGKQASFPTLTLCNSS